MDNLLQQLPTKVMDRIGMIGDLGRVYETESQIDVLWDIDIPRSILSELTRDTSQTVDITINVPTQVAGDYTVVIQAFSEEDYPDDTGHRTRLETKSCSKSQ